MQRAGHYFRLLLQQSIFIMYLFWSVYSFKSEYIVEEIYEEIKKLLTIHLHQVFVRECL